MPAIFLVLLSTILHAGWNLLARALRANGTFLRVTFLVVLVGLPLVLAGGQWRSLFPRAVWFFLPVAGCCQAIYFLGLTKGYQSGDFTLVYPLARSLPILALALVDVARGRPPAPLAWTGMALVSLGCLAIPLGSPGSAALGRYLNRTTGWILVTALGTFGYTTVDKLAAELIAPGPVNAARYQVFEYAASLLPLALLLWWAGRPVRRVAVPTAPVVSSPDATATGRAAATQRPWRVTWLWAAVAALATFAAYWLILWAYQISPYASYVLAMRQLSIVIGVTAGAYLFHEPAPALRIAASLAIACGVVLIALAG